VAFRLDFPVWLKIQNRRKRELAKLLAVGNSATEAAQRFCVSIARISQLRSELQASWQAFHSEAS
jgi:transposase